jgi:hypothetical protein
MAFSVQPYFVQNPVRDMPLEALATWATKEMSSWSMEEIMAVQLTAAHMNSPLMGMALAQDKADLTAAAFRFCGRYWRHNEDSFRYWHGAIPQFYPNCADEKFCETACLLAPDADEPKNRWGEFGRRCGVVVAMDVWRRFAAYGRRPA